MDPQRRLAWSRVQERVNPRHQTSSTHLDRQSEPVRKSSAFNRRYATGRTQWTCACVLSCGGWGGAALRLADVCLQHNLSSAQNNSTGSFVDSRNASQHSRAAIEASRLSALAAGHERPYLRPSREHTNSNSKRRRRTPARAPTHAAPQHQEDGRPARLPHLPQAAARAGVR